MDKIRTDALVAATPAGDGEELLSYASRPALVLQQSDSSSIQWVAVHKSTITGHKIPSGGRYTTRTPHFIANHTFQPKADPLADPRRKGWGAGCGVFAPHQRRIACLGRLLTKNTLFP